MPLTLTAPGTEVYPDLFHQRNPAQPIDMPVVDLLSRQVTSHALRQSSYGSAGVNVIARWKFLNSQGAHTERAIRRQVKQDVVDPRVLPQW